MSEPHEGEHASLRDRLDGAVRRTGDAPAPRLDAFVVESPVTQAANLDRGAYDVHTENGALSYLQDSAALLGAAFVLMGQRTEEEP